MFTSDLTVQRGTHEAIASGEPPITMYPVYLEVMYRFPIDWVMPYILARRCFSLLAHGSA